MMREQRCSRKMREQNRRWAKQGLGDDFDMGTRGEMNMSCNEWMAKGRGPLIVCVLDWIVAPVRNVDKILTLKILFLQHFKMQEYSVIGRRLPTEREPTPKLYRMRIFAKHETHAVSAEGAVTSL